jgi:hypothetical protein
VLTFLAPLPGNELKTFPWDRMTKSFDSEGASDIKTIEDCNLHLVTPLFRLHCFSCGL